METLFVKEKDIVVPGEELAEGMDYLPVSGAYRDGEKIVATHIGIVAVEGRLVKVIPLRGKYAPKKGDVVIGKVADMTFSNWFVDIDCAASAVLSIKDATEFVERGADLSQFYSFGDMIATRITNVTRGAIDLTMRGPGLRKLGAGRIIRVCSSKVPRLIGREGSMISLIKEKTGCRIVVGQNGVVWIQSEPQNEMAAVEAVEFVNKNSHQEGLTDTVGKFLDDRMKGIVVPKDSFKDDDSFYREPHHEGHEERGYRDDRHDRGGFRPPRRDFRDSRSNGGDSRGPPSMYERREMRDTRMRRGFRGGYDSR